MVGVRVKGMARGLGLRDNVGARVKGFGLGLRLACAGLHGALWRGLDLCDTWLG